MPDGPPESHDYFRYSSPTFYAGVPTIQCPGYVPTCQMLPCSHFSGFNSPYITACVITRFILTFAPNWGRDHPAIVVNHGNLAKAVGIWAGGGARGVFYHLILMARSLLAITQNKAVLLADVAQLYDFIFHFRQIRLDLTARLEVSEILLK